jgi:hypothetical protein
VFNSYRILRGDLLALGVGEELSFSKTYEESASGVPLNKDQLEERVTTLNEWMGDILAEYPTMNRDAQRVLTAFLHPIDRIVLRVLARYDADGDDMSLTWRTSFNRGIHRGTSPDGKVDLHQYHGVCDEFNPIVLYNSLQVLTTLQPLTHKSDAKAKKMDIYYETTISFKSAAAKEDEGDNSSTFAKPYSKKVVLELRVLKAFDAYKGLNRLISVNGASPDMFEARFPIDNPGGSFKLTAQQVHDRALGLHTWFTAVLRAYPRLNGDVKDVIKAFFSSTPTKEIVSVMDSWAPEVADKRRWDQLVFKGEFEDDNDDDGGDGDGDNDDNRHEEVENLGGQEAIAVRLDDGVTPPEALTAPAEEAEAEAEAEAAGVTGAEGSAEIDMGAELRGTSLPTQVQPEAAALTEAQSPEQPHAQAPKPPSTQAQASPQAEPHPQTHLQTKAIPQQAPPEMLEVSHSKTQDDSGFGMSPSRADAVNDSKERSPSPAKARSKAGATSEPTSGAQNGSTSQGCACTIM